MHAGIMSLVARCARQPVCLLLLAGAVLAADYLAGPVIQFPILYLLPVMLASWYGRRVWGLLLAAGMPLVRLAFLTMLWEPTVHTVPEWLINAGIRIMVLCTIAYLTGKARLRADTLAGEVRVLRGLLPICAFCKKIRTKDNRWVAIETYISDRSEAQFTHGFCPECGRKHYGEYRQKGDERKPG